MEDRVNIDACVVEILDIGHCILPGHFPRPAVEECHQAFLPLLRDVAAARIPEGNRGPRRWAIGLPQDLRSLARPVSWPTGPSARKSSHFVQSSVFSEEDPVPSPRTERSLTSGPVRRLTCCSAAHDEKPDEGARRFGGRARVASCAIFQSLLPFHLSRHPLQNPEGMAERLPESP